VLCKLYAGTVQHVVLRSFDRRAFVARWGAARGALICDHRRGNRRVRV
jgi:hypothetical protein